MRRWIQIGRGRAGLLAATVALVFVSSGCLLFNALVAPFPSPLPDWMEPGVRTGADFLVREVFVEDERLGWVSDIEEGELDPHPGEEIGVAGFSVALFVRADGTPIKCIDFAEKAKRRWYQRLNPWLAEPLGHKEMVDVDVDGICEFLRVHSLEAAVLLDHQGNVVWSTRGFSRAIDLAAYGDIDRDGKLEFAVSWGGTVALVDSDGSVLWVREGNSHHSNLHIGDVNEDGNMEIVFTSFSTVAILDDKGNLIEKKRLTDVSLWPSSCITSFPQRGNGEYFLGTADSWVLLSLDGDTVVKRFEGGERAFEPVATPVRLRSDEDPYFAVCGSLPFKGNTFAGFEKVHASLQIFDPEHKLVYHEVIADANGQAIAAVSSGRPNEEVLLVGGTGVVWKYSVRERPASGQIRISNKMTHP